LPHTGEVINRLRKALTQPAVSEPSAEAERLYQALQDCLYTDGCDDPILMESEALPIIATALHAAELRGAKPQWQPIETAPKDGPTFCCWLTVLLLGDVGKFTVKDMKAVSLIGTVGTLTTTLSLLTTQAM